MRLSQRWTLVGTEVKKPLGDRLEQIHLAPLDAEYATKSQGLRRDTICKQWSTRKSTQWLIERT